MENVNIFINIIYLLDINSLNQNICCFTSFPVVFNSISVGFQQKIYMKVLDVDWSIFK